MARKEKHSVDILYAILTALAERGVKLKYEDIPIGYFSLQASLAAYALLLSHDCRMPRGLEMVRRASLRSYYQAWHRTAFRSIYIGGSKPAESYEQVTGLFREACLGERNSMRESSSKSNDDGV
jgi:hypothetical protein